MISILEYDRQELLQGLERFSCPSYRTDQILQWVYKKDASDWEKMSNLPQELRRRLAHAFYLRQGKLQQKQHSRDGTTKLLLQWPDEALTETVLIIEQRRRTVCVSSQVGCGAGCLFCASGITGLQRSQTAGEMVEQLFWARQELKQGEQLTNVVIMGMGEPLANYENTLKAVRIINADWGLGVGARHITISTIGLPKQIKKLAHEPLQITLAVSLHAGDDQLRRRLIPWANTTSLAEIFSAIDYYFEKTHREVTLEYVLLKGVNSSSADADKLIQWVKRSRCNVNLINYNPVAETGYQPASPETARAFMQRLKRRGVNVHLRQSRGADIDAACGQLRRRDS